MEANYTLESLKAKSNEELMRLAQKDVKAAYDIIYERLFGKFVNVAYKILRNKADAEDAAQKALMTGYIKRSKFLFLSKVETWLTRILINKAKDIIRKNSGIRNPEPEEIEVDPEGSEEIKTGEFLDPDIDNKAIKDDYQKEKETKIMLMFLEECVKKLSEEEKMSLELREVYEIPYKEIVKILNERFGHGSLGNIKNKADTAKKRLKECIENKSSYIKLFLKKKGF